jgi:hypothetical protein
MLKGIRYLRKGRDFKVAFSASRHLQAAAKDQAGWLPR